MTMRASNFMSLVAVIGLLCADGVVAGDSADSWIDLHVSIAAQKPVADARGEVLES
jgi:hypothetical protein